MSVFQKGAKRSPNIPQNFAILRCTTTSAESPFAVTRDSESPSQEDALAGLLLGQRDLAARGLPGRLARAALLRGHLLQRSLEEK